MYALGLFFSKRVQRCCHALKRIKCYFKAFFAFFAFIASFACIAFIAFPNWAAEKSSANYKDTRNSINTGGARKTSTSYKEDSAIAEINLTTHTSTSYRLRSGVLNNYYYPGTITNLSASTGAYAGSVTLSWTAPGADGNTSNASSYVVKWDTNTFATQSLFNSATTYSQSWTPASQGSSESKTPLTGLTRDTTVYFRVEARDADKNQAYLSNEASTRTPAAVLSLSISPSSYGFSMDLASSVVNTSAIAITNDGNVFETYALKATTATTNTPWSLGSDPGTNVVNLRSGFHATQPSTTTFGAEDVLTNDNQTATSSVFSIDGTSTGANIDISNSRNLWINLRTPLISGTTAQQSFTLTLTASESQ